MSPARRGATVPHRDWNSKVIDHLCDRKAQGWTFTQAWDEALELYKPRARDRMPEERPTLFAVHSDEETTVEFLHRVTADAWHGRRPELRHIGGLRDGDLAEFMTVTDAA